MHGEPGRKKQGSEGESQAGRAIQSRAVGVDSLKACLAAAQQELILNQAHTQTTLIGSL